MGAAWMPGSEVDSSDSREERRECASSACAGDTALRCSGGWLTGDLERGWKQPAGPASAAVDGRCGSQQRAALASQGL